MEILSKNVYEILEQKGIDKIFHANSVVTACQFLRNASLLSRGTVERKKLFQTSQSSDRIDRGYGIWFDVFCDTVDIHNRAKKRNFYGPVLFVLDSKLIKDSYTGKVWVTKLNPTKWSSKSHAQRWFESKQDLDANLQKGKFDQMIVFRHCGGELPIKEYIKEIILDDPVKKTKGQVDFYSMAFGALTLAKTEGNVSAKISKRKCPAQCSCKTEYGQNYELTKQMFFPKMIE